MSTVSVIIPAYNAESFLDRAVQSVVSQSYPVQELIIVDDGSRDGTFECASAMPAPVRAFRQKNAGPAAARNTGAKEATGEWIAFLDADDAWLPGKLERQMQLATADTGLVHCLYRDDLHPPDEIGFDDLWDLNTIATSTVIVRRDVFRSLGGYDEDKAIVGVEDYNLWLKLAAAEWKIRTLQQKLVAYTPAGGSLTSQVERFARAELTNLDKIAKELAVDPGRVRLKRASILDQYGRDLLYYRHIPEARKYLSRALREGFSLQRLAWWLASQAPQGLWSMWSGIRGRSHAG